MPCLARAATLLFVLTSAIPCAFADEPVTLENVRDPGPNRSDEPLAETFSLSRATRFLDSASLQWQKQRKCFTCHTNFAYLWARPAAPGGEEAHAEVRSYCEKLVTERWKSEGPRWDAEVVAAAAALAGNDAATTGTLHPATRTALDRMWTVQRDDGSWDWLKCGWPPMESDDHYGVTLAAIAVGIAPGDYAQTPQAQKGLKGIRTWLGNNPPPTLHHRAMVMWAASRVKGLMTTQERDACLRDLLALQKSDGGWALPTLLEWKRSDGTPQDLETSDGYATGFVLFVLRQGGVASSSDAVRRGVTWLKEHQRESGRWFTRSLNRDNRHFISHAGTAMAIMALAECRDAE